MSTNIINRENAEGLITVQDMPDLWEGIVTQSTVLSNAKKLANMTSNQTRLHVLDSLPMAGFVDGDTGLKPTSKMSWKNKYITAEEIAVYIPIPEAVIADSNYDIIGQLKPRIIESAGQIIDKAVLYGTNKPASWPEGLVSQITSAGNAIANVSTDTLYNQIDKAMAKVEESGFLPTAVIGGVQLKSGFRNMVDKNGQPITGTEIDSIPKVIVTNGAWDADEAKLIVGDFTNLVYAIREDVEFKVFTEGVVTDETGKVIYNLAQQDMVALRFKFRLGWQVPNEINALNTSESTRFPFALVEAAE